jgi:predicted regulator of Ras-like GTPase activity (Roadblock/LC7/MglB family)
VDEAPSLDGLITAFTERVPDVARAAVVSADGLPLVAGNEQHAQLGARAGVMV